MRCYQYQGISCGIYSVGQPQDKLTGHQGGGLSLLYNECRKILAPQWFRCGIFICEGKSMNAFEKSESIKTSLRQGFQDGSSKMAKLKYYGYTVESDGQLVINSDEAQIVRWIFERYLIGDSLGKIASGLEQQGILSPTGRVKWDQEAIDKLLANEKYTGRVLLQKTISTGAVQIENDGFVERYLYTGTHEPIISDKIFIDVQKEKRQCSKTRNIHLQWMSVFKILSHEGCPLVCNFLPLASYKQGIYPHICRKGLSHIIVLWQFFTTEDIYADFARLEHYLCAIPTGVHKY